MDLDFYFQGNWFDLGIIGNDFSSSTLFAIQIQVSFAGLKNGKVPEFSLGKVHKLSSTMLNLLQNNPGF